MCHTLDLAYMTGCCCCCCSVAQSCPTLCDPMGCSTPGFPVLHHLPEFAQTHVHWVGDAIQPPHPLSSPSPPTFKLSQHQGLFQWVSSLHQVVSFNSIPYMYVFPKLVDVARGLFRSSLLQMYFIVSWTLPRASHGIFEKAPNGRNQFGLTTCQVWVKSLSCFWLFVTPWTVAYQAPLSMGFSRQEYWSGLPFPSPTCQVCTPIFYTY